MPEKQHLNLRGAAGTLRKLYTFLDRRQKAEFAAVLLILAVSAALAQYTPLAVGYLTDHLGAADALLGGGHDPPQHLLRHGPPGHRRAGAAGRQAGLP